MGSRDQYIYICDMVERWNSHGGTMKPSSDTLWTDQVEPLVEWDPLREGDPSVDPADPPEVEGGV